MRQSDFQELSICEAQTYQSIIPRTIYYSREVQMYNAVIMNKRDYNQSPLSQVCYQHRNYDYSNSDCDHVIVGNYRQSGQQDRFGCLPVPSYYRVRFNKMPDEKIVINVENTPSKPTKIDIKISDFKLRRVYVDSTVDDYIMICNRLMNASGVMTTDPEQAHFYICRDEDIDRTPVLNGAQVLPISQVREIVV